MPYLVNPILMFRLLFIILALCTALPIFSQGAFLAPGLEISEIKGTVSLGAGAGGGVMLRRWLVGAYGIHTSRAGRVGDSGILHDLDLTFGGLWLGYSQPASDYLIVNVACKGAFGNARQTGVGETDRQTDRLWLLTPEAGVEVVLGNHVRLGLTAGYRIAGDVQLSAFAAQDLRTLVNSLTLKIGKFSRIR